MIHQKTRLRGHAATALLFSALALSPAHAAVLEAESEGLAIWADISLLGDFASLELGPVAHSYGTAPPPYDESATVLEVEASAGPFGRGASIESGTLSSSASSDVDGTAGVRTTEASALVEDLGITLVNPVLLPPLLQLTADAVGSEAAVTGDHGALEASGDSWLTNLALEVMGQEVAIEADAKGELSLNLPAGLAGLSLFLDEQTETGDGIEEKGIDVNALRLSLEAVPLDLLGHEGLALDGELIIAHAGAHMRAAASPVAAPATVLLLAAGLLGLAALRRGGRLQVRSRRPQDRAG